MMAIFNSNDYLKKVEMNVVDPEMLFSSTEGGLDHLVSYSDSKLPGIVHHLKSTTDRE